MITNQQTLSQLEAMEDPGMACPTTLDALLARLKAEFEELYRDVSSLEKEAEQVDRSADTREAVVRLSGIRHRLASFLERLEEHTTREEEQLVPMIDVYFHRSHAPTMIRSVWVMEKDQELACEYLRAFTQGVDAFGSSASAGQVAEMIRCLRQGCRLLKEHFQIEEQTVFPLADELLTDLDALFA